MCEISFSNHTLCINQWEIIAKNFKLPSSSCLFIKPIKLIYLFWKGRVIHRPTGPAPMSWDSRCTWVPSTWWASWQSVRPPSGTRTWVRLTSPHSSRQCRTPWWCRTACWSGWRSPPLHTNHSQNFKICKHASWIIQRGLKMTICFIKICIFRL